MTKQKNSYHEYTYIYDRFQNQFIKNNLQVVVLIFYIFMDILKL